MKQVKKTFFILWIIIMGCTAGNLNQKVKAEQITSHRIQMNVTVNFGQQLKEGRMANVQISVKNKEKEFDGYLAMEVNVSPTSQKCSYQKEVSVKANQETIYEMVLPTAHSGEMITMKLLDQERNVLAFQKTMLNLDDDRKCQYIGTLDEKLPYTEVLEKNNLKDIVIDANRFPEEKDGLDTFETILIDHSHISNILLKQYDSLKEWNQNGGTIIIEETSQKMRKYLGYGKKKPSVVKDLEGKTIYLVFDNGDGIVVEWHAKKKLYDSFQSAQEKNYIIQCITENLSHKNRNRMLKEQEETNSSLEGMLRTLKHMDSSCFPDIRLNLILLCVYIILAGPVLYVLLLKQKRRDKYYIGMILLSICFGVGILFLNPSWKVQTPYVNFVTINSYHPASQTKTEDTYFNIMMSSKKDEVLSLSENASIESLGILENDSCNWLEGSDNVESQIVKHVSDTRIRILTPLYRKSYFFHSASHEKEKGSLSYRLSLKNNLIQGSITNSLGYDLKNVIVIGNYHVIDVKDLKNGDTFNLPKRQSIVSDVDLKVQLEHILEEDKNNFGSLLTEAYYYCVKSQGAAYHNDTFLIGTISSDSKTFLSENGLQSQNMNLVVYPLWEVEKREVQYTFVTDIDLYETDSSYEDVENKGKDERTIEKEYKFPIQSELKHLVWSQELNKGSRHFEISIYNHQENQFETIFNNLGTQKFDITEEYLAEGGRLLLKFKSKETGMGMTHFNLPIISANVEVSYD